MAPTLSHNRGAEIQEWEDANDYALWTYFKNCEDGVRSKIETCELATEAWKGLKTSYEGKTTTEF